MTTKHNRLSQQDYNILINLVFERDKWRCIACRYRDTLQAHHIIYRSQGGKDELNNLATLCAACHHDEHHGLIKLHYLDGVISVFVIDKNWKPIHKVR